MRFVSQIATLAVVWASTVAANADADAEASEFGEMGRSLRNRGVFDRLMKRQVTNCPVGTYCTSGMTCCGYYCCFVTASCNNAANDFAKLCVTDGDSSFNSTNYDTMYDDILSSLSATLSDIYADATSTGTGTTAIGGIVTSATPTATSATATSTSSFTSSSTDDIPRETDTSSSTYSSSSNFGRPPAEYKPSSFASWTTGSKVAVILGPILGFIILACLIWWVAIMTCCKRKHKVQSVANLRQPMASVPPGQPPTMPPTPAPPYGHPNAPELGGGEDHYAYKPDAYGNYQEPPVAPKFDPQTGSYQTADNGPVFEAPDSTADSRR